MSEPTCDPVRLGARAPIRASLRCWAGEECGRLLEFGYSGISFPLACGIHVAAAAWVRRTLRACASSRAAAGATLTRPARGSSARPRAPGRVGIEKGAPRSVLVSRACVISSRARADRGHCVGPAAPSTPPGSAKPRWVLSAVLAQARERGAKPPSAKPHHPRAMHVCRWSLIALFYYTIEPSLSVRV